MIDSKKYTPENPYKHNQQRQDGSRCDYRCDACTWREGQRAQLEAVALEIDLISKMMRPCDQEKKVKQC